MNTRTILMLALITGLVVALAAFTMKGDAGGRDEAAPGRLFPGLLDSINDISTVTIEDQDGKLSLQRKGEAWGLVEKHDYPVDMDKVAACLKGVALMETIEKKTREPKRYDALGVQGLAEGSPSTVLTLADASGKTLASLIVGQRRGGRAAGDEYYVRRSEDPQSWLVSAQLETGTDSSNWIDKQVAKVERTRVQSIQIEHADGETLQVSKASEDDTTFTVHSIPEGRELSYPTVADGLANTLEWLNLDDVVPTAEFDLGEEWSTKTTFWTFDGMKLEATLTPKDGATWAQFEASFEENGAPFDGDDNVYTLNETLEKEIEKLNERMAIWTYKLPVHALTSLDKRMEQLLKPLPVETEPGLPEDGMPEDPLEGMEIQDLLSPEQIEQINKEHGTDIPVEAAGGNDER